MSFAPIIRPGSQQPPHPHPSPQPAAPEPRDNAAPPLQKTGASDAAQRLPAPNPDAVPAYLANQNRWLLWRTEERVNRQTGETTKTKVPISYHTSKPCDVTDPRNWTSCANVTAALTKSRAWDGVGFALGEVAEHGEILIGLDLDACLDDDGAIADWAMPFLVAMASYAEISPSGLGIKCIARIRHPDLVVARKVLSLGDNEFARTKVFGQRTIGAQHAPGVQLFLGRRYFTITGRHWVVSPEDVTVLTVGQLDQLGTLFGPQRQRAEATERASDAADDDESEPDETALRDKLGVAFVRNPRLRERWEGGVEGLSDSTRSGRDMSVLAMLVSAGFTKGEVHAALRLFGHGKVSDEPPRYFDQMWSRTTASPPPEPPEDWEAQHPPTSEEADRERGEATHGDDVLEAIRQQGVNLTLPILIGIFNRKYAVANEGGKAMVMWTAFDPQMRRDRIERASFDDFRKFYCNHQFTVIVTADGEAKKITKTFAGWWLDHPHRRQYLGGVVFDPGGTATPGSFNLWRGWSVAPAPGDWSLMSAHIHNVICGGRSDICSYVLRWLAHMIQYPDQPAEVAIVMRGEKGIGKGIFGKWLLRLCGQHGLHIINAAHLTGHFTGHLRDVIFVFADEALYAGTKQHEGILKGIITEGSLLIEAKYRTPVMAANMLHILLSSNNDWVVPASHDERRYLMLDVSAQHQRDFAYFSALNAQMESGGLAAMLHDLAIMDISGFRPREVPDTPELAEQKLHSLDTPARWWLAVLARGFVWRSRYGHADFLRWDEFVTTELLTHSYAQWCAENRVTYPAHRAALGRMLAASYPSSRPRAPYPVYEADSVDHQNPQPVIRLSHQHGYKVGALDNARTRFRDALGITTAEWDHPAEEAMP